MKKYLKICLILFSICLVCAVATAGVNLFTAPVIEENSRIKRMEAYRELFPTMSENSEFIDSGFSSLYIKEKVNVLDDEGNLLGYGFESSGSNQYGAITLVVGLDAEGNLLAVRVTENGQTKLANELTNWAQNMSSGMTANDVADLSVVSGATYGSNLIKNLVSACFAEAGIMTDTQKRIVEIFGDSVDMANSVADNNYIYAQQINEGYLVKDGNNTELGYYYDVVVTNSYGNINVGVALNMDKTVKEVMALSISQTGGRNEMLDGYTDNFTSNMTKDDVSNVDVIADATYGANAIKYAVLTAINEVENNFDEDLALKIMYNLDYASTTTLTASVSGVDKYLAVNDADGEVIGHTVSALGSNSYGDIKLYVGLDSNNTLAGIFILENGQTAGKNESLSAYLDDFSKGMTGSEAISLDSYADATFASNTAKDIIATAFEQVTGERPTLGYDSYYESIFTGVSLANSKEYNIEGLDSQFVEGKELYDANNNLLGYAFVLTSNANEFGGTLTLMVGVQISGKLEKVIMIANNQTGGYDSLLDGYEDNFTSGMSPSDVEGVASATPQSPGSAQFKELVVLALKVIAAYDDYYVEAFGEDATFEEISSLNRAEIIQGIKALNGETVLGYAYVIRLENAYGYNVMCVALNSDGTYKKLIDIENNHANLTEISTVFKDGSNMEEIIAQGNSEDAIEIGASYTSEIATLGIKIAMDAYGNALTESISDELYIKTIFNNAVMRKTSQIAITNTAISKAYKVVGSANYLDNQVLGYVYFLTVENNDILMSLVVGVDSNHNYVSSIMTNYETKTSINIGGSFKDTLQGRVNTYLETLEGMNSNEIKQAPYFEAGSYASQLVKYALRLAIAESNSKSFAKPNLYADNEIYLNTLEDLDLTTITRLGVSADGSSSFLYPETISGIRLADGSSAYIIDRMDVYSHNYILVYLASDGTLISVYDVENNHGSISGVLDYFTSGMSKDDVINVDYNPTDDPEAHSSYTVEMTRLAVLVAMQEFNADHTTVTVVDYERAVKELFPFAIYTRGVDLLDDVSDENIDFAMEVKDVLNGEVGQSLGYVFVKNNVMIATDTFGLYVGYKAFSTLTEEDKDFYDSIKAGMSKAEISELTGSETAKNNVLDIYAEVFNFAKLTEYDSYIETSFNEFSTGDSVLLNIKNNYEVLTAVEVKDDSAKTLGYAYAIYLENAYGNNTMLIALNADGTFKQALDINNNHSNIDKWQETNPNVFTSGMTLEQINNIKYDVVDDASFTIESIKLGILIAMNEQGQTNNSNYEAAAKKVFSGMVTGRSTILNSFSNQSILYGYDVIGAASSTSGNPTEHLGYAYVVKGTLADVDGRPASASLTLMVGVNLDGTLAGVVIVENGQTAGRASTIADYITRFTSGMSASDVNAVEYVSGATYGCNLVKHLINIALEEGGNN